MGLSGFIRALWCIPESRSKGIYKASEISGIRDGTRAEYSIPKTIRRFV